MTRELVNYNSLGVSSTADELVVVTGEDELREIVVRSTSMSTPLTVLGGGTNVVLRRRLRGLVIILALKGIRSLPDGSEDIRLIAAAGENWHHLVRHSLGRGWYGLENLALIPGTVGAAPIQNIGAYGVELAERFVSLRAMDRRDGSIREFDRASCLFAYRDSLFKPKEHSKDNSIEVDRYIILDVTLLLSRQARPVLGYPDIQQELADLGVTEPTPAQVAEAVIRVRRRKLPNPASCGNVGSFFKNPLVDEAFAEDLLSREPDLHVHSDAKRRAKLSAAQLIDLCGFKGVQRGPVGVWRRQPLVFVNLGLATGEDFLSLAEEVQQKVFDRFEVSLQLEPRVLGES
ncbi:MAG: UDP-N-acetylmuramate dehydrogenase [Gammaproteobacteria bacterium]|nr:UDP-N-acetylmuramate dehydrogenase [Gammaproteobacteria bacterium]